MCVLIRCAACNRFLRACGFRILSILRHVAVLVWRTAGNGVGARCCSLGVLSWDVRVGPAVSTVVQPLLLCLGERVIEYHQLIHTDNGVDV